MVNRGDVHREAHRSSTDRCATACAATGERGRQVCYAPLPSTKTVPASLRATEQGQQGHRARDSVKLPDRAELGVQRRFSSLGALVADSRLRQMRRFPGNGRELRLHFS
jgi:hypothetical protein